MKSNWMSIRELINAHEQALETIAMFMYGKWYFESNVAHLFIGKHLCDIYWNPSHVEMCEI